MTDTPDPPIHDNKGKFAKGNQAAKQAVENRTKRSKADIKALCRRNSVRAVRTLVAIMTDAEASTSDRIKAATYLLDRGWGRPETEGQGQGLFAGATIVVDTGIRREQHPMVDVTPQNAKVNGEVST